MERFVPGNSQFLRRHDNRFAHRVADCRGNAAPRNTAQQNSYCDSYCAATNSIFESLVTLEPGAGICSVIVPLVANGEGVNVVFASLSPVEAKMRSASVSGFPT